jgi:hypothetical protein
MDDYRVTIKIPGPFLRRPKQALSTSGNAIERGAHPSKSTEGEPATVVAAQGEPVPKFLLAGEDLPRALLLYSAPHPCSLGRLMDGLVSPYVSISSTNPPPIVSIRINPCTK